MSMTAAERDAFLRETRIATLCTLNADGSPNAMPLWYEWDGEKIRMFSSRNTGKVRRLTRDPRACISVEDPVGAVEAWVTVEGTVEIHEQGGMELALKLAAVYYAGEQLKTTLAAWSQKDDWLLLELTPTRIRSM
jgi:PPOX class probable F420-dependent enzyme